MVGHVNPDLFQATGCGEWCDGVDDWAQPAKAHARSYAHHIRLCDTAIHETLWRLGAQFVKQPVANISGEQNHPLVSRGQLGYFISESVPHRRTPSLMAGLFASFNANILVGNAEFFGGSMNFFSLGDSVVPVVVVFHERYAPSLDRIRNDRFGARV